MEFRKIFDTIPEQFDKFRPRYSQELFDNLIDFAKIGPEKKVPFFTILIFKNVHSQTLFFSGKN